MSAIVVAEAGGAPLPCHDLGADRLAITPLLLRTMNEARFLPGLVSRETVGAYALIEPLRSDALGARLRHEPPDGARAPCEKMWSRRGIRRSFVVFAKVDCEAFTAFSSSGPFPGVVCAGGANSAARSRHAARAADSRFRRATSSRGRSRHSGLQRGSLLSVEAGRKLQRRAQLAIGGAPMRRAQAVGHPIASFARSPSSVKWRFAYIRRSEALSAAGFIDGTFR